jgi:hypothetical protein
MTILNNLNTCVFNGNKPSDPIVNRRKCVISGLRNQIESLQNQDIDIKRPWYKTDDEGLKGSIRFMNKPFDLGDGNDYFLVENENELINVYEEVIKEVMTKKLDDVITKHVSSMKSRS